MTVVGIDLGTTNTVVACVREGRVHVLADEKGNRLLPSVVSFHPNGDVLVGYSARERRLVDARNTIASIKRLIGRPWDSDEIRLARSRFPFELREGPGQGALVIARNEAYTLPEISAFVLKRARQIAEGALGEAIDQAVITVPAHFNELQRASTKVAGRVAGLEVLRILNEPTAAALAYGFGSERNERIAVYDFGGGTFDCSLLDLTGNLFEVLATAGDTFLGGDDVDTAIAEVMCNAFLAQHRYDPRVDPQAFERLRAAAEGLKRDLSVNPQSQIDLPEVAYGVGGKRLGFTFGLTQADLDVLATPFVDRTLQVTQDALNIARLSPSSFDHVVLVGGSTRMPLVARRVEAFFGVPVISRINPDEVVAIGAAVQAAALGDTMRKGAIPTAPTPGVIGAPQPLAHDDAPTTTAGSSLSAGGGPSRRSAPPPLPGGHGSRTLRPGVAQGVPPAPGPLAATPPSKPSARPAAGRTRGVPGAGPAIHEFEPDDQSLATDHTLPAGHANVPAGRGENPSLSTRADFTVGQPPPASPGSVATSAPPSGAWGSMNPLETEDISRIVPDAFPQSRTAAQPLPVPAGPPSAPPSRPLSSRSAHIAPLATEDISLIAPEHSNPGARAVGPLHTEDLSLIAPDLPARISVAARSGATQSARPGPQAPFAFPPVPPSGQPPGPTRPPAGLPAFDLPLAPAQPAPPVPPPLPPLPPLPPRGAIPPFKAPVPTLPSQGAVSMADDPPLPPGAEEPPLPMGWQDAPAPVLVDVTPRALVVETVGGYCDIVIPRNARIPCEHTRAFATGRDLQTTVHVRVAQGEEQRFERNQYLGELELSDLRPAPRGEIVLKVTFELDANGSLLVRAVDSSTGRQTQAKMKLIAVNQSEEAIEEMIERSRSVSIVG